MILTTSKTIFAIEKIMKALKVIFELTKFRLSFLVSFSAIVGFILASDKYATTMEIGGLKGPYSE